jgi:hypothetical protein
MLQQPSRLFLKTITGGIVWLLILAMSPAQAQDATWRTILIPGICSFQIPPTIEIQKGTYKEVMDKVQKAILKIDQSPDRVIAQPKGINDFDPIALARYCRVMVETEKGSKGDYLKLSEPLVASEAELRDIDKQMKNQVQAPSKDIKMTVLSWQPSKIIRVNGVHALLITYTRSVNDAPPVLVRMYMIQNDDALHKISISYRESEKHLWAADLNKVIDTFKFEKR